MEDKVEFSVSVRGKTTLIQGNYEYWFHKWNQRNEISWRFCKFTSLKGWARVKTFENRVIEKFDKQTHEGNTSDALTRKAIGKMKERLSESLAQPSSSQEVIITVQTNIEASKIPSSIDKDLISLVAPHLKIPEQFLWVLLQSDLKLTRGGEKVPLVMAEIEIVGRLKPKVNLTLGSKLDEYFMKKLGLPPSNCAVRFTRLQSRFTYSTGGMISSDLDYDEDLD